MLLAAEFNTKIRVPSALGNDSYDAGYKILDALSCDLALESGILDLDELN